MGNLARGKDWMQSRRDLWVVAGRVGPGEIPDTRATRLGVEIECGAWTIVLREGMDGRPGRLMKLEPEKGCGRLAG